MHSSCDGVFKGWVLNVEQAAFKEVFFSISFDCWIFLSFYAWRVHSVF
jgi:hypothetical protein